MDSLWLQAIPLALIYLVFHVLVVQPPRRREARRYKAVATLTGGEEVVTKDGLVARVLTVETDCIRLELAPGLAVDVIESAITEILHPERRN